MYPRKPWYIMTPQERTLLVTLQQQQPLTLEAHHTLLNLLICQMEELGDMESPEWWRLTQEHCDAAWRLRHG